MQLSILSVAVLTVVATVHAARRTADEYWSDEEPDYTPDQIIARLGGEDRLPEELKRAIREHNPHSTLYRPRCVPIRLQHALEVINGEALNNQMKRIEEREAKRKNKN